MRRFGQALGGLVVLVATVVLLVGVPFALVRFVGWPLPTALPTLNELQRAADLGVADATIIKTLAVVVWIAWSQIALGVLAEVVALVRRRPVRAWFVLPGAQALGSRLVAAALLVAATLGPRTELSARPLESAIGQADSAPTEFLPDSGEPAAATAGRDVTVETTTVTTGQRASWWQLAEDHLGDGLRWREIRDLNVGRDVAAGVRLDDTSEHLGTGWSLLVPVEVGSSSGESTGTARAVVEDTTWVVEPGDHFWEIAEETLTETWDRAPADQEVASYWRDVIEDNRDHLVPPGDPDLIHPGQEFALPEIPADPLVDTAADAGEVVEPPLGVEEPPSARAAPSGSMDTPRPAEGPTSRSGTESSRAHEQPRGDDWRTAVTGEQAATVAPTVDADGEARSAWGTPVGLTSGVAAAGLLGAGTVAMLRRRRRAALQRHRAGLRLPTPAPDAVETEAELAAAAPSPERLTDLAALLATIPVGVGPVLVTTTEEGDVTLLFDDDDELPNPPQPWTLANDGVAGPVGWTAQIGVRGTPCSIGLPLLVTLGRTGSTNVLANIGAMRILSVTGELDEVRACLRRMTLEAGTSPVTGPLDVVVVGDGALATVPRVRHTADVTVEVEAAEREQEQGVVLDDRTVRLLICHDQPELDQIEDRDGLTGLVVAHREAERWQLRAGADVICLNLPDGAVLDLVPVDADVEAIEGELAAFASDHEVTDLSPEAEPSIAANGRPHPSGPEVFAPRRAVEAASPWCEVRVLGRIQIVRAGEELRLSSQQRELLGYLACHPDADAERVENALWAGQPDETGQRLRTALTTLRATLGDDPDGSPAVARRTGPGQGIRLSRHVGTDAERALATVAFARSLDGPARRHALGAALDLVRGEPFQNLPASWTTDLTYHATAQLQQAALELAVAFRAEGQLDEAEHAIRKGLRLCDPAEMLYEEWTRIESARGRPERVRALRDRLENLLTANDDPERQSHPPERSSATGGLLASG